MEHAKTVDLTIELMRQVKFVDLTLAMTGQLYYLMVPAKLAKTIHLEQHQGIV